MACYYILFLVRAYSVSSISFTLFPSPRNWFEDWCSTLLLVGLFFNSNFLYEERIIWRVCEWRIVENFVINMRLLWLLPHHKKLINSNWMMVFMMKLNVWWLRMLFEMMAFTMFLMNLFDLWVFSSLFFV